MTIPRAEEPDEDALRNGAQLYDGYGRPDPRLVAAERVIMQLRTLLGAVAAEAGGRVTVTREQLHDARARSVHIDNGLDAVTLSVPVVDEPGTPEGEPASDRPKGAPQEEPAHRASHSSLMRKIEEIRTAHPPMGEQEPADEGWGADRRGTNTDGHARPPRE